MRVLFIITRSDVIGGASVHLLDLARGVQESGNEVLIAVGGDGIFITYAEEQGLNCISIKNMVRELDLKRDIVCYFELRELISDWNPDIIHAHSSKAGVLGRYAARSLNVPCVFTAHGWAFTEGVSKIKRIIYCWVERLVSSYSSKIITVSNYDRELALRWGVGSSDLIVTVHNGMPPTGVVSLNKRKDSGVKLIMVARLEAPKDHAFLLKALALLPSDKDWSIDFVGDGPNMPQLKKIVDDLNLSERVSFLGACSDVAQRLADSDVFCLLSNWEGFPLTILEAMRAGLPVIASSVGGVPEAVDNLKTGFLIEPGDISALVKSLSTLISSEELRSEMGREGLNKFKSNFTFDRMLERTIEIYNESFKS